MKKKDCELGMFVAVMQNVNPLARNRLKIKRIGKVVGIYDDFVNLLLFDSNIGKFIEDFDSDLPIVIKKKLYNETFGFYELHRIKRDITYEKWTSDVPLSVN